MTEEQTTPVIVGDHASVEQAQAYQARRMAYAQRGDVAGLVRDLYTEDARLHGFDFRAEGREAIKAVIELMARRLAGLGPVRVQQLIAGRDFIWQELSVESQSGRIEPYEMKFLRDGQVYLQLYGSKRGSVWQPGDLATAPLPDATAARQLHHRYIDYQVRSDADGLADHFFSADALLATPKIRIEGREALRAFFRDKFHAESGFHLESLQHITGDHDYVWFEGTAASSLGARTVYDVMLLRGDEVCLQLVGTLQGILPADAQHAAAGAPSDGLGRQAP